jgi:hypothetical protein
MQNLLKILDTMISRVEAMSCRFFILRRFYSPGGDIKMPRRGTPE